MFALMILFCVLLFIVYYITIEIILFKGKQHNRFFATFLNTFVPVFGSVPAYIMACKYERRICRTKPKKSNIIFKCIIIALQILSVLLLFLPIYKSVEQNLVGMNLFSGKVADDAIIKPIIYLVYIVALPLVSALINIIFRKSNVSNFITYSVSLLNALTIQLLGIILSSNGVEITAFGWIYSILNIAIMLFSIFSMVANRDTFLFKLEYKEKIEYIKEQQNKKEAQVQNQPDDSTYKCAKCGNFVKKGSICSCIEKKDTETILSKSENDDKPLPDSYCVYCRKPLEKGAKCNCQGDGFGISIKSEVSKNRKCMYCGQVLVGESTCVCEKIMKNSAPVKTENNETQEPKRYFESQIERGNSFVADELAELEKKINQRFEMIKESMSSSENK